MRTSRLREVKPRPIPASERAVYCGSSPPVLTCSSSEFSELRGKMSAGPEGSLLSRMAAQVVPSVASSTQLAEPPLLRLLFRHTALVRSGDNMRSAPLREVLDRSVER